MENFICKAFLSTSIILLALTSCKDIIQDDLTDKQISLIIPQNNYITPQQNVQFKWNELEDANNYTIEIVSPSFSNIISFPVDSVVENTTINFVLQPGEYEWRVKANNTGSSTQFSLPYKLTIDTSSDLSNYVLQLIAPATNFVTNNTSLVFSWQQINVATEYDFILKQGTDWNTAIDVTAANGLTITQQTVNNLNEGEYIWGVQAKNNIPTATNFSTFNLYIDTTKPQAPTLFSPTDNYTTADSVVVNFSWNNPPDAGNYQSDIYNVVEIYSDSLITLFDTLIINGTTANYTFNQVGTYFWRIQPNDKAGNTGIASVGRKIIVQ